MTTIKTVGDLRELIKDMDDNLPVVSKDSNYETGHALTKGAYMKVETVSERQKHCRDDFDGTPYTITHYVTSSEGEDALIIY